MNQELEEKEICHECIGDAFLKAKVENEGDLVGCSYCDNDDQNGFKLLKVADLIDTAFQNHYIRSSESPPENWSIWQLKNYEYEPDGEPIVQAIMEAADIEEEIASDVQQILKDKHYDRSADEIHEYSEYHDDSVYDTKYPEDSAWQEQWTNFERSLKTKNRFFSKEGASLLSSIFAGVDIMNTHDRRPVSRMIGPGTDLTHLDRARVFQADLRLKEALEALDKELGSPPDGRGTAGRMNSKGVSMFYGATSPDTALAEVRPPVGSKVVVAKFEIIRPLRMMDLTALTYNNPSGSIFDPTYVNKLSQSTFLSKLSQKMTSPVMPDDEYFEYLSTQVIADFVDSELGFDGFIFPSAQSANGVNVVLFNKAARVEEIAHSEGTTIQVELTEWDDEIEIPSYSVVKWIPEVTVKTSDEKDPMEMLFGHKWMPEDPDARVPALKIDEETIVVKHITSIKIESNDFKVWDQNYTISRKRTDASEDSHGNLMLNNPFA